LTNDSLHYNPSLWLLKVIIFLGRSFRFIIHKCYNTNDHYFNNLAIFTVNLNAYNRSRVVMVPVLWWGYGSQKGCDDEENMKIKSRLKKIITCGDITSINK